MEIKEKEYSKLTEDEKKDTESLIEDLKKSLEGNDVEEADKNL